MTRAPIVPRPVGKWCLSYLHHRISEASLSFRRAASDVELSAGHTFVYAPRNADLLMLRALDMGGLTQGEWLSPHTMQLSSLPQLMLCRYLRRWLNEKDASQPPQLRLVIAEDLLWRPGDPIPPNLQHTIIFDGTLYLWARSRASAQWIETLVSAVDLAYPPALIYGFEVNATGDSLGEADVLKILQEGGGAAARLRLIVVGAYDGESFLVWRRRGA